MGTPLEHAYSKNFIVRPPVPATVNRGGENYMSEVGHLEYNPREAYDEWVGICEAIRRFGGDAILMFEESDEVFLGHDTLVVDGPGNVRPLGSNEALGRVEDVLTGRVFTANGPWIARRDRVLRAVLPNLVDHRKQEHGYFEKVLWAVAEACDLDLSVAENPYRWEGMADVAPIGERVLLTYTVRGHYDRGQGEKSLRSSKKGLKYAADFIGVPESKRIYAELVHPHFHGDTVHFVVRPPEGPPKLVQYPGGLYDGEAAKVKAELGKQTIIGISQADASGAFAANSRQVGRGVLVPKAASETFSQMLEALGLKTKRVPVAELFGKGGGGPGCATLQLPDDIPIPKDSPLRYSVIRDHVAARRDRIPSRLMVSSEYYEARGRNLPGL